MAKFYIGNKEVSSEEYKDYLRGDSNVIDVVEKEEIKIKTDKEMLFEELTTKIGFSFKRANKVIDVFNSKKELIEGLDNLPFSDIENKTLIDYFEIKTPIKKRVKKEKIEEEE